MGRTRKKTFTDATVSYWYGVDATQLSPVAKAGLLANLKAVQAQQEVVSGNLFGYEPEDIERLYNLAYRNPELARAAKTKALQAKIQAQCDAAAR